MIGVWHGKTIEGDKVIVFYDEIIKYYMVSISPVRNRLMCRLGNPELVE